MEAEALTPAAGGAAAEAAAAAGKGAGDAAAKEKEEAGGRVGAAARERRERSPGVDVVAVCTSSKETQQKLQQRLRDASVPADVFWQDLHAHAAKTCGGPKKADAVVAAFKTIHAKRLANMNLEQTDALCKDVLTLLLQDDEAL